MTRFLLWTFGGVLFGLMIHLVVILNLPRFASNDLWDRVVALTEPASIKLLDAIEVGADNDLGLDPALAVAVCRFDLSIGPGLLFGPLPDTFWSVAVFNAEGIAIYSTTHRAASENTLNLGIFNPSQTRVLAEQEIADQGDLLVVESPGDQVFATVRLAPPHPALMEKYRLALAGMACENLLRSRLFGMR